MLNASIIALRRPFAKPAFAGRSPVAYCTGRSIQADGHKIAPGVRNAPAAATWPATLRALPNRALYPDCARTHRHGRHRVARPWALERARRHQPLPHPLGVWRAIHRVVAELHSALHRPFQESASTRPVGRACSPQRPRTNAAVPINPFGSWVRGPTPASSHRYTKNADDLK
jgi:hypothetical protein